MSELELVSYITEENKRRKRRRIVLLSELYFESVLLGIAFLSSQQGPRNLECFSDDERRHALRKYLLKQKYDEPRLAKRNFNDLCTMGDAILCMLGDIKTSISVAVKSTEPLPLPKVTPPAEILAALELIPDLARCDKLRSYGKLILSERLFQALMELPMALKKQFLLMLNEKDNS